jgi:hypothetical protein
MRDANANGGFMKRVVLAFATAAALTLATALPVASEGLTETTVSCDDGTTFTSVVSAESLAGLVDAVQAMTLFPAGLTCVLTQAPVVHALGGVASAWPGGGFIVGGGRFQVGCPNVPFMLFWVNFAISAHTVSDDAGDVRGGTLNLTIPAGQCVGPSHLTSKPYCLRIDADSAPPPPNGAWYAYLWSHVTNTSGSFWANAEDTNFASGWKDTGNPGHQLSPDREADHPTAGSCPAAGSPHPDDPWISHPILNGNVTIHPAQ